MKHVRVYKKMSESEYSTIKRGKQVRGVSNSICLEGDVRCSSVIFELTEDNSDIFERFP